MKHELRIEGVIVTPGLKINSPRQYNSESEYETVVNVTPSTLITNWRVAGEVGKTEYPLDAASTQLTLYREGATHQMKPTPDLKTPFTHPDHWTVGHYFAGWGPSSEGNPVRVYYCDSYDPRQGYWLTSVLDSADRKNVSERAIGRTFHEADDLGDHWCVQQWGTRINKDGTAWPTPNTREWEERMEQHWETKKKRS